MVIEKVHPVSGERELCAAHAHEVVVVPETADYLERIALRVPGVRGGSSYVVSFQRGQAAAVAEVLLSWANGGVLSVSQG